ncbi:MAG: sigma-54 dependent transcriptional regulator [Nitrospiraceae bacterium]|nr:sigma-54 dependent transcriptional regulator [Nitrospiraceae bacterium]
MIRILAVDDEEPFRRLLKRELARKGFYVEVASDGNEALSLLKENAYDIILLDIVMPGEDGISLMKKMKGDPSAPVIIVLTGRATVQTAVAAMKEGAYDYLTKPCKLDELVIIINRAYDYGKLSIKNRLLEQELVRKESSGRFVYKSRQLEEVVSFIKKIAPTDSPVFIQGESGTGKELAANLIWRFSRRSEAPFIALNCASLSEGLMESELFGHEKGAFTNAYKMKHGIVEVADKGTLFLDEIGEMSLKLQAKLLRFLDSGEFRRVGGDKNLHVDVRVVAATNRDFSTLIKDGLFREDLYYRLNVFSITIPPLRQRPEDIRELAGYFLEKFSRQFSKSVTGIDGQALQALMDYQWPGNVRELENIMERAVILCDSASIGAQNLLIPEAPEAGGGHNPSPDPSLFLNPSPQPSLEEMEKNYILRVLQAANGNQSKTSQILGIDRKTLYLKLKKYGVEVLNEIPSQKGGD